MKTYVVRMMLRKGTSTLQRVLLRLVPEGLFLRSVSAGPGPEPTEMAISLEWEGPDGRWQEILQQISRLEDLLWYECVDMDEAPSPSSHFKPATKLPRTLKARRKSRS